MFKIILAAIFITSNAFGSFLPLKTSGQSATTPLSTYGLKAPYNQLTTTNATSNGITRLLETGYQNLLLNPDFENVTPATSWTSSGAGGSIIVSADSTNVISGKQAVSLALTGSNGLVFSQDVTPTIQISGQNFEYGVWVKTSLTTVQVCARNAGATVGSCSNVSSDNVYHYYPINYPAPASGSVGVSVFTTGSTTGTVVIDNAYVGYPRNIGTVAQATYWGGARLAGAAGGTCSFTENTSTGNNDFKDLGTGSGCNAWTSSGNITTVATNDHRIIFSGPGEFQVKIKGAVGNGNNSQVCNWQLSDGTNVFEPQINYSASDAVTVPSLEWHVSQTDPSSKTYKIQAAGGSGGSCSISANLVGRALSWDVYRFPSQSQQAINSNLPVLPTIQKFTAVSSSTYVPPVGVSYIHVRMVGGGGGGAAAGAGASAGTLGGTTTFGTLTANGGQGTPTNSYSPGIGGTASLGTGPVGTAIQGGNGGGVGQGVAGTFVSGGSGASSPFGSGGGGGTAAAAGGSAIANTGAGGGGGGGAVNTTGGAGGSAGGYIDAIIYNPGSLSYSVGAGGSGGTGGSGGNGGNGGSGYIEVTEYYQNSNAPVLIGSVTSSSAGMERVERVIFGGTSSTDCTTSPCGYVSQSGSWLTSVTRTTTGEYRLNIAAGMFSSKPTCTCVSFQTGTDTAYCSIAHTISTATTVDLYTRTTATNTPVDSTPSVLCQGPRN